jgi:hypothetical protein
MRGQESREEERVRGEGERRPARSLWQHCITMSSFLKSSPAFPAQSMRCSAAVALLSPSSKARRSHTPCLVPQPSYFTSGCLIAVENDVAFSCLLKRRVNCHSDL